MGCVPLVTVSFLVLGPSSEPGVGPSREEVVAALRHQEGLVQTLRLDYDCLMRPTSPAAIARLRNILGDKEARKRIITADFVRSYNGTARLWWKGVRQRREWTPQVGSPSKSAFDGQIYRSVVEEGPDGLPIAVIADDHDWSRRLQEGPLAFYLYDQRPLSTVVATASRFSSSILWRGQERLFQVVVSLTEESKGKRIKIAELEFLFDDHFRQRERLFKGIPFPPTREEVLVPNQKFVFLNYRAQETSSGETIWFPGEIHLIGYSTDVRVREPDGGPVEVCRWIYRFTQMRFNEEMPDSLFTLAIPSNARVNDLLTGAGWLPRGERPAVLFPEEARGRRLLMGAIVLAAVVLVTLILIVRSRRQSRTTPGSR
jgi:hypothetical protein